MIRKKPDEKIYARLFDMFSLNPEECFLWTTRKKISLQAEDAAWMDLIFR